MKEGVIRKKSSAGGFEEDMTKRELTLDQKVV